MSEHLVARAIAGPLTGSLRRLIGGDAWRIGTPPMVLLTALGEGRVRIDPLRDGVRLADRPLVDAESIEIGGVPCTLALPDGSMLWLVRSTASLPARGRPARAGAALHASELELQAAPTLPSAATSRWRLPRAPLRIPRVSLPWRVSRSVAVSVAVHAVLAVLLAFVLMLVPDENPSTHHAFQLRFVSGGGEPAPEDREGAAEATAPKPGEGGESPHREEEQQLDEVAAVLDAEVGRGADAARDADSAGVSAAPAGALLAARRGGRERLLREGGGDAATEGALSLALGWLSRHQGLDGSWSSRELGSVCRAGDTCPGSGERMYREATTALALLPFLGAGHTHRSGPWRETIRDGLAALIRMQRDDGSFATDTKRVYASAIAALALTEAYGLTGSAALREPAQRSVTYFVNRQSESGGWRYHPGDGKADTSVTGWVTLALVSAKRAGLDVPRRTLDGCRRLMVARTADDGRIGYLGRGAGTDALLGVGLFSRALLGADATGPELAPTARRLAGRRPEWPPEIGATGYGVRDPMHWYYGSLAAFQAGGDAWLMWEPRLRRVLLRNQEQDGCRAGSWDAVGSTGAHGGRIVSTALCALCLEVTYRYPRATFGR